MLMRHANGIVDAVLWTRYPRHMKCPCWILIAIALVGFSHGRAQESASAKQASTRTANASSITAASVATSSAAFPSQGSYVADGALHGCAIVSIDCAFAVGDRGLILSTNDGGKRWQVVGPRIETTFYAIGFDLPNPLEPTVGGLIVGGTIDPVTGRSEGTIKHTKDDGKSWTDVSVTGLPRLTGLQRLGHRHWIAWGDWSDHWQTALFETLDGGKSWNARPTPSGHVRSAAFDGDGVMLIVDRSGGAYRSDDGLEFQRLEITSDPFRPIRFCKRTELGWWLGGDQGQLFFSSDSVRWRRIQLPGNASDHALISLRDLTTRGSHAWLIGDPGAVVWHSRDSGQTWQAMPTQRAAAIHSINSLDENVVVACGTLGRILISRNGGQAWWDSHAGGDRVACLAIASVQRNLAWDVLAYVTHENKRRAAAIAIHDQHFHQSSSNRPEMSERIASLAARMNIEQAKVLPEFPIGDLRNGIRTTDLAYYQSEDPTATSELVRKLVLEIRTNRPDLLVSEDSMSKQSLETVTGVATQQAVQLAAAPSYCLFSAESGIDIPAWNVQRVLTRNTEPGGLVLAPTMLLNSCGMLLSEAMRPAHYLPSQDPMPGHHVAKRNFYRPASQRTTSLKHPMEGLVLDASTQRIETRMEKRKVPVLLASSSAPARAAQLLKTRGAGLVVESAWDDALREFATDLPPVILVDLLWSVSIDSRRSGNWHRWNTALNMILEKSTDGPMAELAYSELMTYFGSPEIQRIVQEQMADMQAKTAEPAEVKTTNSGSISSPFATRDTMVAFASHENQSRLTPIARFRGTEAFSRLLSRWPDAWLPRRTEPEWAWLITARYRSGQLRRGASLEETNQSVFWPPYHAKIHSWTPVLEQERALLEPSPDVAPMPSIPNVAQRPYLDGHADDAIWRDALPMKLHSFWKNDSAVTEIRFARDSEFLFLYCHCPRIPSGAKQSSGPHKNLGATSRKADSLNPERDHVRLRIDLDRDYATWYEFAWDCEGDTLDQVNDMAWWNPSWFVAFDSQTDGWNAEIAIPLESILPRRPSGTTTSPQEADTGTVTKATANQISNDLSAIAWDQQVWGISVVRERPSEPMESLTLSESDVWTRDQWLLVSPHTEQPSQPNSSEQPSISSLPFRGATR